MRVQCRIFPAILVCVFFGAAFTSQVAAEEAPIDDAPIIDEVPDDRDEAIEVFANNFVLSVVTTSIQHGKFYQGQYHRPLKGAEFYEAVHRPDLADSYRTRRNWTWGVALTTLVASPAVFFVTENADHNRPERRKWSDAQLTTGYAVAGVLAAVSFATFMGIRYIGFHPIEPHEARRITNEYNRQLADELGIDEDEFPDERLPNEDAAPDGDLRVDLFFGDDQDSVFGLTLRGQF